MSAKDFKHINNILPFQGEVFYFPLFFNKQESGYYLQRLVEDINWKQEPIKIFGKEIMQPRLTAWFGDKDYSYSGIKMRSEPFPALLSEIVRKVEKHAGSALNSALLNFYRDGKDSMGWHRDNEKELGNNPLIASLSFGAKRKFRMRNYKDKNISFTIELEHGSLLLMRGETQHCWEHAVSKTNQLTDPRVNITFRNII